MEVDSPSTCPSWLQWCGRSTKRKPEFESAGPGLWGTLLGLVRTRALWELSWKQLWVGAGEKCSTRRGSRGFRWKGEGEVRSGLPQG